MTDDAQDRPARWRALVEIGAILLICFLIGGGPPPDVNEAHYLCKAKHYWQPDWGAGDWFLASSDAHLVFYWSFGWLTKYFDLSVVAWIGRISVWLLFAWSFRRLVVAFFRPPWVSVLLAAAFLTAQQWGHMAGEWVIGGVEAKGFAFPLVFLGLEALVRSRWGLVWVCFGAAAAFHVLVGGWAVIAAICAWLLSGQDRMPLLKMLPWLVVGGLLSLPGLLPVVPLNLGVPPEVAREANQIYVNERISHHLLIQRFGWVYVARHVSLILLWFALLRDGGRSTAEKRLARFVLGSIVIAMAGTLLSPLSNHAAAASLLRFYWFRLSDVAVPLGLVIAAAGWAARRSTGRGTPRDPFAWVVGAALLVCLANLTDLSVRGMIDPRSGADRQSLARHKTSARTAAIYADWRRTCDWIAKSDLPMDTLFLTPRRQQTFKWFTGRPEVISWKDIPQDAAGLVDWSHRQRRIFTPSVLKHGLDSLSESELYALCKRYNAQFAVIERRNPARRFAFPRRFPRPGEPASYYEVYQVLKTRQMDGE